MLVGGDPAAARAPRTRASGTLLSGGLSDRPPRTGVLHQMEALGLEPP